MPAMDSWGATHVVDRVGAPAGPAWTCLLIYLPRLPQVCEHSAQGDQSESMQLTGQSTTQPSDSFQLLISPDCRKQEQSR